MANDPEYARIAEAKTARLVERLREMDREREAARVAAEDAKQMAFTF
jgi:hypothetical protein